MNVLIWGTKYWLQIFQTQGLKKKKERLSSRLWQRKLVGGGGQVILQATCQGQVPENPF